MPPRRTKPKTNPPPVEDQEVDGQVIPAFAPGDVVNHISDPEDEAPGVILCIQVHIDGSVDYVVEWCRDSVSSYKAPMLRKAKY